MKDCYIATRRSVYPMKGASTLTRVSSLYGHRRLTATREGACSCMNQPLNQAERWHVVCRRSGSVAAHHLTGKPVPTLPHAQR